MTKLEQIKSADYSTMVGWIKERNRPSGGVRTLCEFAVRSFLRPGKSVLEVGSNTGFSMVNVALLTGARCTGIDINQDSVEEAKKYAKANGVQDLVDFQVGSALGIPFPDNSFDALWVSNVTSFIDNKSDAFKEYLRVLKPNGIFAIAPIYYKSPPPDDLFAKVEELVNAKINIKTLSSWKEEILQTANNLGIDLVEYQSIDYQYDDKTDVVEQWTQGIIKAANLPEWTDAEKDALVARYVDAMKIFNENLKYCNFSLVLYQKRLVAEERELFTTRLAQ